MAKPKTQYVCQACGQATLTKAGQCPHCSEWGTLVEETVQEAATKGRLSPGKAVPAQFTAMSKVEESTYDRLETGVDELDRVLGGGLVIGSYVLLGGAPGFGKSTLTSRVLDNIAAKQKVALVAGEESAGQVRMRMNRLKCKNMDNVFITTETDIEKVTETLTGGEYDFAVIDSIQSMFSSELNSIPGSIGQVREVSSKLTQVAKQHGVSLIVIGQSTKDSSIAGPRALEHQVDVLLYLEGDRLQNYRILRSIKNRFGSVDEIGVFEMAEEGMVEISDPTRIFLTEHEDETRVGSAIAPIIEGSRPMLVEVQALVAPTSLPQVRRVAQGINLNRLNTICAILSRKAGYRIGGDDVYVNVMGGLKVSEPALDFAVAAAIASAKTDRAVRRDVVFSGEISLLGEIRRVSQAERRRKEANRLGYARCLDTETLREKLKTVGLKAALNEALEPEGAESTSKSSGRKGGKQTSDDAGASGRRRQTGS